MIYKRRPNTPEDIATLRYLWGMESPHRAVEHLITLNDPLAWDYIASHLTQSMFVSWEDLFYGLGGVYFDQVLDRVDWRTRYILSDDDMFWIANDAYDNFIKEGAEKEAIRYANSLIDQAKHNSKTQEALVEMYTNSILDRYMDDVRDFYHVSRLIIHACRWEDVISTASRRSNEAREALLSGARELWEAVLGGDLDDHAYFDGEGDTSLLTIFQRWGDQDPIESIQVIDSDQERGIWVRLNAIAIFWLTVVEIEEAPFSVIGIQLVERPRDILRLIEHLSGPPICPYQLNAIPVYEGASKEEANIWLNQAIMDMEEYILTSERWR